MTKEEIRQKAAIAVLPMCVGDVQESVLRGFNFDKKAIDKAVVTAVAYADALVEKLKVDEQETEQKFNAEKIVKILKEQVGFDPEIHKIIDEHFDEMLGEEPVNLSNLEQNGKDCKPANFAKSSKDLREAPHGDVCKGCKGFEETGKCYCEGCEGMPQWLTEFEKAFVTSYDAYAEGFNTIMKWRDYAKLKSKQLLDIAYKQFKQDQMNQEFATFTRQEFNDAVDEEIKRRCEGIKGAKMSNDYYNYLVEQKGKSTEEAEILYEGYTVGVHEAVKKIKGE